MASLFSSLFGAFAGGRGAEQEEEPLDIEAAEEENAERERQIQKLLEQGQGLPSEEPFSGSRLEEKEEGVAGGEEDEPGQSYPNVPWRRLRSTFSRIALPEERIGSRAQANEAEELREEQQAAEVREEEAEEAEEEEEKKVSQRADVASAPVIVSSTTPTSPGAVPETPPEPSAALTEPSTSSSSSSLTATSGPSAGDLEAVLDKCDTLEPIPEKDLHRLFDGQESEFKNGDESKRLLPRKLKKTVYFISRQAPLTNTTADEKSLIMFPADTVLLFSNSVESSELSARQRTEYGAYRRLAQPLASVGIELLGTQYRYQLQYSEFKDAKVTAAGDRKVYLQHLYRNTAVWGASGVHRLSYVPYGTCNYSWIDEKNQLMTVKKQGDYDWIAQRIDGIRLIYRVHGKQREFYSEWRPASMSLESGAQTLVDDVLLQLVGYESSSIPDLISRVSLTVLPTEPVSNLLQHRLSGNASPQLLAWNIGVHSKYVASAVSAQILSAQQEAGQLMLMQYRWAYSGSGGHAGSNTIFNWPYDNATGLVNPRKAI